MTIQSAYLNDMRLVPFEFMQSTSLISTSNMCRIRL